MSPFNNPGLYIYIHTMGSSAEDIWEGGAALTLTIFGLIAAVMIFSADSTESSADIFAQSITVLVLSAFPTSELGVFLAVFMAIVGASISASMLGAKLKSMVFAAGFFWVGTNIVLTWFFGPL